MAFGAIWNSAQWQWLRAPEWEAPVSPVQGCRVLLGRSGMGELCTEQSGREGGRSSEAGQAVPNWAAAPGYLLDKLARKKSTLNDGQASLVASHVSQLNSHRLCPLAYGRQNMRRMFQLWPLIDLGSNPSLSTIM